MQQRKKEEQDNAHAKGIGYRFSCNYPTDTTCAHWLKLVGPRLRPLDYSFYCRIDHCSFHGPVSGSRIYPSFFPVPLHGSRPQTPFAISFPLLNVLSRRQRSSPSLLRSLTSLRQRLFLLLPPGTLLSLHRCCQCYAIQTAGLLSLRVMISNFTSFCLSESYVSSVFLAVECLCNCSCVFFFLLYWSAIT